MGVLKTFLVSSNLALLLALSFSECLAYKHPVLGIEEGQGLPAEKLSVDTLRKLNDDPGYAEFEEVNYVQTTHCWLNAERLAAQQFADRLKGSDATAVVNLVGQPFSKWKKLSYWRKEGEPGEDWIYLLGFESVPVHLHIAENKCIYAVVLSDEDFARYYTYMDDRINDMVGKTEGDIKALLGEPRSDFVYMLNRSTGPSLIFNSGKCASVGFAIHHGYKGRDEKSFEANPWAKGNSKSVPPEPPENPDWFEGKGAK